ncbi:MAG: hypothetical protein ACKV2U_19310 [Bryobacteraceae bacterium]
MFRRFAKFLTDAGVPNGPEVLMKFHPSDLTALLELAWDRRSNNPAIELGRPARRSAIPGFGTTWFGTAAFSTTPPDPNVKKIADQLRTNFSGSSFIGRVVENPGGLYDHLIYAYMIENTRVLPIFRRVLHEFLHGEKLGVPGSPESQLWLRSTEEMFFRDPPPFFITAVNGHVRPDIDATRRNAYQRMFAMDLNHGAEDNKPFPYVKAEAANSDFVGTFEELLREVWIGIENENNFSGAKPTDDAKIADLAEKLHDMLISRRQGGNLSREEFVFVSMLSWFHLTLDTATLSIIRDLRAEAASPEERLFKIAQRVGLPAHGLSKNYFDIADSISRILILIETGIFNTAAGAPALYTKAVDGPRDDIQNIIRHWSIITGREMKARKVTPS